LQRQCGSKVKNYFVGGGYLLSRFEKQLLSMIISIILLVATPLNSLASSLEATAEIQFSAEEQLEMLESKRELEELNFQMGIGLSDALRDGYLKLQKDYPNEHEIVSWAEYRLAEWNYSRDQFEDAINRLEKLIQKNKKSDISIEASILLSEILDSPYNPNRDSAKAMQKLEVLSKDNPKNERISKANIRKQHEKNSEEKNFKSMQKMVAGNKTKDNKSPQFITSPQNDTAVSRAIKRKENKDLYSSIRSEAFMLANDGNYKEAYGKLDQMIASYPEAAKDYDYFSFTTALEDMKYQQALLLIAEGKKNEALEALKAFSVEHASSHLAQRALQKIDELQQTNVLSEVPNAQLKTTTITIADSTNSDGNKTLVTYDGMLDPSQICSCGPVALKTALAQMGYKSKLDQIIENAGTTISGTTVAGLIRAANKENQSAFALTVDKDELTKLRLPAILLFDDHYVTITKITGNRITYHDPLEGWKVQSMQEVQGKWTGHAIVFAEQVEKALKGLQEVKVLSLEEQELLKGRYLCGNAGGEPPSGSGGGDPEGPGTGAGSGMGAGTGMGAGAGPGAGCLS
jgi:tetratricopeptide (TPR) repeat protein